MSITNKTANASTKKLRKQSDVTKKIVGKASQKGRRKEIELVGVCITLH